MLRVHGSLSFTRKSVLSDPRYENIEHCIFTEYIAYKITFNILEWMNCFGIVN